MITFTGSICLCRRADQDGPVQFWCQRRRGIVLSARGSAGRRAARAPQFMRIRTRVRMMPPAHHGAVQFLPKPRCARQVEQSRQQQEELIRSSIRACSMAFAVALACTRLLQNFRDVNFLWGAAGAKFREIYGGELSSKISQQGL